MSAMGGLGVVNLALSIAGLIAVTVFSRGFFALTRREVPMPDWLRQGLRYAPVGALLAVLLPELLLNHGHLISTWRDPRLAGALAAVLWLRWRRDTLGTILVGTGVMLICRLSLGWGLGG